VILPFEAPRAITLDLGHWEKWHREKGELLRPGEFSDKEVQRLRRSRNFATLYQQDPSGTALPRISFDHFNFQATAGNEAVPAVVSIDTGQSEGDANSFSVVQVWRVRSTGYFLADQWRGRVQYDELRSICRQKIRRHQPCTALIEKSGMGLALLSDLKPFSWMQRLAIVPRESKAARLRAHISVILDRKITLPHDAEWRDGYVAEFVSFPKSKFSDQVDATTQFLEFVATNPALTTRQRSGVVAVAYGNCPPAMTNLTVNGIAALVLGRRFR
jgi:predicted phage terminase large subunit-like protein